MSAYDPTDEQLDRARQRIARVDRDDLQPTLIGQLAGRLDSIQLYGDPAQAIREMRAALAAYDERKAATA